MLNRKEILAFVKAISGNANVVAVPRVFVTLTGDIALAAMLSQLIYWSDRAVRKDRFVYKTARDWFQEIGATKHDVQKFKNLPYIETKLMRANASPTTHYKVNYEVLVDMMLHLFNVDVSELDNDSIGAITTIGIAINGNSNCQNWKNDLPNLENPPSKNGKTLTEITTEITTETTTDIKEVQDIFSAEAEKPLLNDSEKKSFDLEEDKEQKENRSKSSYYQPFLKTLSEITNFDLSIRSNAGRLGRASSQLIKAGYTIPDLNGFLNWWMDTDWRWKKDKQMPTPENVLDHIGQYKKSLIFENYNRRRYEQWLKKN